MAKHKKVKLEGVPPAPTVPPLPALTPELYAEIQLASIDDRNKLALARIELVRFLGGTTLIGASVCIFAFYTFYMPVKVAHGETTTISVFQQFLADVRGHVYVAWGAGAVGAAYGAFERRRRKKECTEKDATIKTLQAGLLDAIKSMPGATEKPQSGEAPK